MGEFSEKKGGFTIVELLIVVVVIAILAAITIVAYNGIQSRAHNTVVESDISAMVKKLEATKVTLGRYPQAYNEFPEFKISKGSYDPVQNNFYYCLDKANDQYVLGVRSKANQGYMVRNGAVSKVSSVNGAATCDVIGKTWVNDTTTLVIQGYTGNTGLWNTGWGWTN